MKFVNYSELEKTIKALTKLQQEIREDKRIQMDNALANLITKATVLQMTIDADEFDYRIKTRAKAVAEAVKELQKVENSYMEQTTWAET